ncbi:hypothetical protein BH11PLA2_BH11PLA2_49470 [soil metagenome]
MIGRERLKAVRWGLFWSGLLAAAIFVGSRNLRHIDAALVGYTFACLFAAFAVAYRYSMWLQRPPTRLYWRRGWESFLKPGHFWANVKHLARQSVLLFALNVHIFRRSKSRGVAHLLIMWGCVLASAITFPLVYGWVFFETVPGDLTTYRAFAFGYPLFDFAHESLVGHLIFHGLVWSALLVIPGVLIAFQRRVKDHSAAALQDFQEDILPLFLLFAISITGLLLTVSYTWMKGYGYEFLAILHAVTVIFTLLWLPFGKFFHIFQRPAQLGVKFYRDIGELEEPANCVRCSEPFATPTHIRDLIQVEAELGYDYSIPGEGMPGHYQHVCPKCRRRLMALSQHAVWHPESTEVGTHGN